VFDAVNDDAVIETIIQAAINSNVLTNLNNKLISTAKT